MDLRSHHRWPWRRVAAVLVVPALGVFGAACDDDDSSAPASTTGAAPTSVPPSEPSTDDTATTVDTTTAAPASTAPPVVASTVVEQTTRSGDVGVAVFGVDQGLPQDAVGCRGDCSRRCRVGGCGPG